MLEQAGPVVLWRGAHTGAGLLAGFVIPQGIQTAAVFLKDCPMERTHAVAVHEELSSMGRTAYWSRETV